MPLNICVAPTETTYGDDAGQSGCVVDVVHDWSELPWEPQSPEETTTVMPARPIFASNVLHVETYERPCGTVVVHGVTFLEVSGGQIGCDHVS